MMMASRCSAPARRDESGGQLGTVYTIFERQGDRWLADEIVDFSLRPGEEEESEGT